MNKRYFKIVFVVIFFSFIFLLCTNQLLADTTNDDKADEPFEDIGENYYKEAAEEDIVYNEEHCVYYVKNQLLISAMIDTDKKLVVDLIDEVGADLVGYIELTNDYQIEFKEDKNIKELEEIANYIDTHSFVAAVTLNIVILQSIDNTDEVDNLANSDTPIQNADLNDNDLNDNVDSVASSDIAKASLNVIIQVLHKLFEFFEKLHFQDMISIG